MQTELLNLEVSYVM